MRAADVACARPDVAAGAAGVAGPVGQVVASAHRSLAAVEAVLLSALLRLGLGPSGTRAQGPGRRPLWGLEPAASSQVSKVAVCVFVLNFVSLCLLTAPA